MQFIQEIIYEEVWSEERITDVDAFFEPYRTSDEDIELYFEVGADSQFVHLLHVWNHPREREDRSGERRPIHLRRVVIDKKTKELIFTDERETFPSLSSLSAYPVWRIPQFDAIGIDTYRPATYAEYVRILGIVSIPADTHL